MEVFNVEETKAVCDVCEKEKELTYSKNLEKYMCEDCLDEHDEGCRDGLP
jgi:hypothetical protein